MTLYYVQWRGQLSGPFEIEQLRTMYASGELSKYHQVSSDQSTWIGARNMPELQAKSSPPVRELREKRAPKQDSADTVATAKAPARPRAPAWYYIDGDDITQEVTGKSALKRLLKDGTLERDDLICRVGTDDWVEVSEVLPAPKPPPPQQVPPVTVRQAPPSAAASKGADEIYCPSCSAVIKAQAALCVHCGVERRQPSYGVNASDRAPTGKFNQESSAEVSGCLISAGWITAFILPLIGAIIGIFVAVKGKPGHGVGMLLLALFSWQFWSGFWPALLAAL